MTSVLMIDNTTGAALLPLRRYAGAPTTAPRAKSEAGSPQKAEMPVSARPMSSFWIWLVPS
jgi:hypothetical protein